MLHVYRRMPLLPLWYSWPPPLLPSCLFLTRSRTYFIMTSHFGSRSCRFLRISHRGRRPFLCFLLNHTLGVGDASRARVGWRMTKAVARDEKGSSSWREGRRASGDRIRTSCPTSPNLLNWQRIPVFSEEKQLDSEENQRSLSKAEPKVDQIRTARFRCRTKVDQMKRTVVGPHDVSRMYVVVTITRCPERGERCGLRFPSLLLRTSRSPAKGSS